MKKLKLSKFELDQMPEAEMSAIRAGSGVCQTGTTKCFSDTGDADNSSGDSDSD